MVVEQLRCEVAHYLRLSSAYKTHLAETERRMPISSLHYICIATKLVAFCIGQKAPLRHRKARILAPGSTSAIAKLKGRVRGRGGF